MRFTGSTRHRAFDDHGLVQACRFASKVHGVRGDRIRLYDYRRKLTCLVGYAFGVRRIAQHAGGPFVVARGRERATRN